MSNKTLSAVLRLSPFVFIFAFALDIYVPSIPSIHAYFDTTPLKVQLTVSLFLMMTGIGQLIAGPLSDRLGRKKIILFGTLTFLLGSLIAALAPSLWVLMTGRMTQGLGACCMMVGAFAMVRDLFTGSECSRIYSFLNATISLSPLLAPIAGGYLEKGFGWRASFVFLVLMSLPIAASAIFTLKESLPLAQRTHTVSTKKVFSTYLSLLKNPNFAVYTFCASSAFAAFLTFFSVSSYIIISLLGVSPQHFGYYFAFMGAVFVISSLISGHLCKLKGTYFTVLCGALLMAFAGLTMLFWYLFFNLSLSGFLIPMIIMGIGGSFLISGGAGGAIEPFPKIAGTTSALFGFCEFIFAFLVSTFVLHWRVESTEPLALTLLILGVASTLAIIGLKSKHHPPLTAEDFLPT